MQVPEKKMVETLDQNRPIGKMIVLTGYLLVSETGKTKAVFTEFWMSDID